LRPLATFYLLLVPLNLAIFMTSAHIPFVLVSDGVVDASRQSLILGSSFLMNLVTAFFYGRISKAISARWMFILLIGIFATSDLVIGISRGWVGTMAGCWIGGWGGGIMMPLFVSVVLARTPEASRARALGVMYTTMYVGDFLNPVLITPLRLQVGNHQIFAIIGGAMVLAAVALALFGRPSAAQPNITEAVT